VALTGFDIDPPDLPTPGALIDVTRLVRRRAKPFGTGVDRIDLAFAQAIAARLGPACRFVFAGPFGPATLDAADGAALLEATARRWRGEPVDAARLTRRLAAAAAWAALRPARARPGRETYVVASHGGLAAVRGGLARLDPGGCTARLAYVHDLIPLDYPEYQRPRTAAVFTRFLEALAAGPLWVTTNSRDTARRMQAYADARGWPLQAVTVRAPRLRPSSDGDAAPPRLPAALAQALREDRPVFLCVGTIEPRKNHLLLLTLWRAWAGQARPPLLALVGRRGWENEMVVDMLERCVAIRGHVLECNDLDDAAVRALMRRARALLMPSFAEGLGVPVLEAAALGLPVIASDLPALREIAAPGAVFLDPLDGPAWRRAVEAAAA